MGNTQSYIAASLSLCSVYFGYIYIYRSHKLLHKAALNGDKLPSFVYLYIKYLSRAVTRRTGHLYAARAGGARAVVYTVLNCRLDTSLLRRFCGAAGYGWDYPDTEYRDIPLCFPEVLCSRPLLMLLTDGNFRLSPAGLVRVRQSLKTLQPIDELKKGPFLLQVTVQGYQQTDAGVEVDVCLSATSRSGCPVWESVLTLLSKDRHHKASRDLPRNSGECDHCYEEQPADEENLKQVEIRVPRTTGLRCVWSFTDYSPHCLLSLPAMFCSLKSQTAPAFWMLSVCLAEIEKHKGVEIITAPVSITAQFKETQPAPGKITIRFWEISKKLGQSANKDVRFQVQLQGQSTAQMIDQDKYMKKGEDDTNSTSHSPPPGSSSVEDYHDCLKVGFKMYPRNDHAMENISHRQRDQLYSQHDTTYKISSAPDLISKTEKEQTFSMRDNTFHRNSTLILNSSSQVYSGPEDNSTEPHESLTESSTITFMDSYNLDESVENHTLQGVGMIYLKEFVLIDDDEDGDMSLREKTVTDFSVRDGKAADLVCGRLLSTSTDSLSECKDESSVRGPPPPEAAEAVHKNNPCCLCTLL